MGEAERTAVVVGAGIAGLAAAASLLREGWDVTLLEQAPRFAEVGAGLAITANGFSALSALGLDAAARAAGHRVYMAGTMDQRGRWLLRIPRNTALDSPQETYGIHRQQLHRLLLEAAGGARFVADARVISVGQGHPDGVRASVQCVSEDYPADLVVAADGLRSVVRTEVAPATLPSYSGKSSWRGIVDDASLVSDDFVVRWGPGTEFGAVRISDTQVYWYGYTHSPENRRWPDEKAAALEHFSGWAEPVSSLIGRTAADKVMRHDVFSIAPRLRTYVYGRTVLVGDAAHAMVPTMGQGANSSLEDGVCVGLLIGRAVNSGVPLGAALQHFDSARRSRTQGIVRRSEHVGRLGADLRGKLGIAVRNAAMKAVPGGPAAAAGASILSWKAPR